MSQKLKILIYNIAANYTGYGDYGRIDKIREKLVEGDWDIIGINEVYNKTLMDILLEDQKLQAKYPYAARVKAEYSDIPIFTFENGLVILSKHKITKYERIEYEKKLDGGINKILPPKDALYTQVEMQNQLVDIFFTHLQWGDLPNQIKYRNMQFAELAEFVKEKGSADIPAIVCGDMNIYGYPDRTGEYKLFTEIFSKFTDYHAKLHPDDPASTWSPENIKIFKWFTGEKFDYILGSKHFKPIESNVIKYRSRVGPYRMKWKPTKDIGKLRQTRIQLSRLSRALLWPLMMLFNLSMTVYRLINGHPQVLILHHKDLSDHYALENILELKD